MKNFFLRSFLGLLLTGVSLISCKRDGHLPSNQSAAQFRPRYSSIEEFRHGISRVVDLIQEHRIYAYLDTVPNGRPDVNGRRLPLAQFGYAILEKLNGSQEQIASGVYDVFHFDGATFSLISFIMKAQMVGDISAQSMVNIISAIPLPPIAVANFQPPVAQVAPVEQANNCCDNCNPQIKIKVTWAYKSACGNYERETSGYAANNTLNNMSGGRIYRFDAEISGCPCPGGVLTSTVTAPAGASYGTGPAAGGGVTLFPVSSGTYTVTFTYKVCDKTVTKTFTLTVK
ncbi:MAG TPA: hypothetical protein VEB63_06640 [Chitinophagaceae bacterium]|nr:hypothetical protein [Chitinophagaceae bacterium]